MQHRGTHRGDDARDLFRDVAVADQPNRARSDVADRLAELRVGRPAAAVASRLIQHREAAQGGQHQQHRSLGYRRRVGAGHVGNGDTAFGGGVDVDGIDPGAELVHQPQASPPGQIGRGKWPQHMPNHVGLGYFPVEGLVRLGGVVIGTPADVKPIRFRRKEIQHLRAGNEVGEDP